MKNIILEREIKKGQANAYGGLETSTPRKRTIPLKGIYMSWSVNDCYLKEIELDGKKYNIAFQCRVHPKFVFPFISSCNKKWLVVPESKYIRPYGIVVRGLN